MFNQQINQFVELKDLKMGGKCQNGVESKSLEILKEMAKGKQVDMIVEGGQGLSSWIRFGGRGLAMFSVGFEICRDSKNRKPLRMEWKDGEWVNKLVRTL